MNDRQRAIEAESAASGLVYHAINVVDEVSNLKRLGFIEAASVIDTIALLRDAHDTARAVRLAIQESHNG